MSFVEAMNANLASTMALAKDGAHANHYPSGKSLLTDTSQYFVIVHLLTYKLFNMDSFKVYFNMYCRIPNKVRVQEKEDRFLNSFKTVQDHNKVLQPRAIDFWEGVGPDETSKYKDVYISDWGCRP